MMIYVIFKKIWFSCFNPSVSRSIDLKNKKNIFFLVDNFQNHHQNFYKNARREWILLKISFTFSIWAPKHRSIIIVFIRSESNSQSWIFLWKFIKLSFYWDDDSFNFIFIIFAASSFEMLSTFFHLVRRFWNQILTCCPVNPKRIWSKLIQNKIRDRI